MMQAKRTTHSFHFFYGWYILASSFLILFFTTGARFTIGVVFKPLMAEFGWDRGLISLAFFLNMTIYAFSLIIIGRAYDRHGPKWVIMISAVFLSVGFMSLSLVEASWQFFVFYGILAALGMGGTTVPLFAALMSKWFERGRGLAVSMGLAGSCMGQFILVPAFTVLVLRYGWRISYFCIGLIMLVVIMTLALVVIKGDPHDLGLEPWGHENRVNVRKDKDRKITNINSRDLGLTDAMKTYSFWLFVAVMFVCGSGDFLVTTHLIPMVTDYNIPATTAGNMLAWLGLMSLPGILIAGPLSDVIGNKIPIVLTFLMRFALFILILKFQGLVSFYVFACAFGFTLLITAPLNALLVGKLYGFSHVGLLSGFITTIHHLGGGFWAYLGGEIFDRTGSYDLAFILSALMALVAVLCTVLIKEKKHEAVAVISVLQNH
jgi:MFS family permease